MKTVLISAFEAFGEDHDNPTESVLADIPDFLYDARIVKVTLPVVYGQAFDQLLPLIEKHQPKVILMLGLAGGRSHISIERIAINIASHKQPDNLGNILTEHTIQPDGQDGYFTTLPLTKIMQRLTKKELPVVISNTAGSYLCNQVMYETLHYIAKRQLDIAAGFIHIPYFPYQVYQKPNTPSLDKTHTIETILTIIDEMVNPIVLDIKQV